MKKALILILITTAGLLAGCVESTLVVGPTRTGIAAEDVVVYYIDRPRCNFETLGHIQVTGGYYSLESMLNHMRREAGMLGASGLYVLQTQQLDIKDFLGTAKAIHCLSV